MSTDSTKCLLPPVVKPSASIYRDVQQVLSSLDRQIDEIIGDGNCLFRTLSKTVFGVETGHLLLRGLLTSFTSNNQSTIGKFCNGKIEDHCAQMSKEATFGTQAELHAAASFFQAPIFVLCKLNEKSEWTWIKYAPIPPTLLECTPDTSTPPSHFRFEILHQGCHFSRIAPKAVSESELPTPELSGKEDDGGTIA